MTNKSNLPHKTDVEDDFVSKTQLKNEAKAAQSFGKTLIELSAAKLESLPLSETTINAVNDFHKQSGNIAKKRHLAFIGKCLRNEDVDAVKTALSESSFNHLREQAGEKKSSLKSLVEELLAQGDTKIHELTQTYTQLDRQKLRQLLRNALNAKSDVKREVAVAKLTSYLQSIID